MARAKCECETKQRLLQTASDLLWENSYGSVSVDDICTRASVRKGSFYYFFPSKSDLAVAALEARWNESKPDWDRLFAPEIPPAKRILNYAASLHESQTRKRDQCGKVCGCPYASVGAELSTQDDKIRLQAQRLFERSSSYFESALRDLAATRAILEDDLPIRAQQMFALTSGMLLQAKIHNDPDSLRHLGPALLRLAGIPDQ